MSEPGTSAPGIVEISVPDLGSSADRTAVECTAADRVAASQPAVAGWRNRLLVAAAAAGGLLAAVIVLAQPAALAAASSPASATSSPPASSPSASSGPGPTASSSPSPSPSPSPSASPPVAAAFDGTAAVGALFTVKRGKLEHFCTAAVVHSTHGDLVITAAHCIQGRRLGAKSTVTFAPDYHDGKFPYGRWLVRSAFVDGN